MKRKLTHEESNELCHLHYLLAEIMDAVGVAEFKKSSKNQEIFWDTANGGQIDPDALKKYEVAIEVLHESLTTERLPLFEARPEQEGGAA